MRLARILAVVLLPVALKMIHEQLTGHDLFALFGGVPDAVEVREGRLRAQGPFSHSILAGGVGAACVPFMIGIWRRHPLGREARSGVLSGDGRCLRFQRTLGGAHGRHVCAGRVALAPTSHGRCASPRWSATFFSSSS